MAFRAPPLVPPAMPAFYPRPVLSPTSVLQLDATAASGFSSVRPIKLQPSSDKFRPSSRGSTAPHSTPAAQSTSNIDTSLSPVATSDLRTDLASLAIALPELGLHSTADSPTACGSPTQNDSPATEPVQVAFSVEEHAAPSVLVEAPVVETISTPTIDSTENVVTASSPASNIESVIEPAADIIEHQNSAMSSQKSEVEQSHSQTADSTTAPNLQRSLSRRSLLTKMSHLYDSDDEDHSDKLDVALRTFDAPQVQSSPPVPLRAEPPALPVVLIRQSTSPAPAASPLYKPAVPKTGARADALPMLDEELAYSSQRPTDAVVTHTDAHSSIQHELRSHFPRILTATSPSHSPRVASPSNSLPAFAAISGSASEVVSKHGRVPSFHQLMFIEAQSHQKPAAKPAKLASPQSSPIASSQDILSATAPAQYAPPTISTSIRATVDTKGSNMVSMARPKLQENSASYIAVNRDGAANGLATIDSTSDMSLFRPSLQPLDSARVYGSPAIRPSNSSDNLPVISMSISSPLRNARPSIQVSPLLSPITRPLTASHSTASLRSSPHPAARRTPPVMSSPSFFPLSPSTSAATPTSSGMKHSVSTPQLMPTPMLDARDKPSAKFVVTSPASMMSRITRPQTSASPSTTQSAASASATVKPSNPVATFAFSSPAAAAAAAALADRSLSELSKISADRQAAIQKAFDSIAASKGGNTAPANSAPAPTQASAAPVVVEPPKPKSKSESNKPRTITEIKALYQNDPKAREALEKRISQVYREVGFSPVGGHEADGTSSPVAHQNFIARNASSASLLTQSPDQIQLKARNRVQREDEMRAAAAVRRAELAQLDIERQRALAEAAETLRNREFKFVDYRTVDAQKRWTVFLTFKRFVDMSARLVVAQRAATLQQRCDDLRARVIQRRLEFVRIATLKRWIQMYRRRTGTRLTEENDF